MSKLSADASNILKRRYVAEDSEMTKQVQKAYDELVAERIASWLAKNPRVRFVDAQRLGRAMPDVPPVVLEAVLTRTAADRKWRKVYKPLSPDGDLLEGEYDSPDQFPATIPNRFCSYSYPREECEAMAGYLIRCDGA